MTDVTYGVETDPNDPLVVAAKELTPDKSLTRIGANAKFTITTVAIVGTLLTGFGLGSVDRVAGNAAAERLAVLAVIAAFAAIVLALAYLAIRLEKLNVSNLDEVAAFYRRQFQRSRLVVVSGGLLVVAVVFAGLASISTLLASKPPPEAVLQVTGTGATRTVSGRTQLEQLEKSSVVTLRVTGATASGEESTIIDARAMPDRKGKSMVESKAEGVPALVAYRLSVLVDGQLRAEVKVP